MEDRGSTTAKESGATVKFLCSYGGKILPWPPGSVQLRYTGGETRMLAVTRNISYHDLMIKVSKLFGPNLLLKYQLPNEDLDTLVSVTCDDDVDNMMDEYDKNESREGSSRLRTFLFPSMCSTEDKYTQAASIPYPLRSVQAKAPDYLFGLEPVKQHTGEGEAWSPTSMYTDISAVPYPLSLSSHARDSSLLISQGMRYTQAESSAALPNSPLKQSSSPPPLQQTWGDGKKIWEVAFARDEKQEMDLNIGDGGSEAGVVRVAASTGRVLPDLFPIPPSDSRTSRDRRDNFPSDEHSVNLDSVRAPMGFEMEGATNSAKSYRLPPDLHRGPGVQQFVLPQGYDQTIINHSESGRSSDELDQEMHRRIENLGITNNAPLPPSVPINMMENHNEGLRYLRDGYRLQENLIRHQIPEAMEINSRGGGGGDEGNVAEQRRYEYEVCTAQQGQQLGAYYGHYFGKGQAYWQGREVREQQQHQPHHHQQHQQQQQHHQQQQQHHQQQHHQQQHQQQQQQQVSHNEPVRGINGPMLPKPVGSHSNMYLPPSPTHRSSSPSSPLKMRNTHTNAHFPSPLNNRAAPDSSLHSDRMVGNNPSNYNTQKAQNQESWIVKPASEQISPRFVLASPQDGIFDPHQNISGLQ